MRKIIFSLLLIVLSSSWANGATYYVSQSLGNDSNSGTVYSAPWKSLGKVNGTSFSPGDKVLFRCGDTWTASYLQIPSSGTAANPITYAAYYGSGVEGWSGDMPTFNGGLSASTWTVTSGAPAYQSYTGLINIANKSYITVRHINVTQSGGRGINLSNCNYVTITRCMISKCFRTGIGNVDSDNTTLEYNRIDLAPVGRLTNSNIYDCAIMSSHGVGTYGGGHTIQYNWITRSHGEGIDTVKGNQNCVIQYNRIENTRSGILYAGDGVTNITIRYNLAACTNQTTEANWWPQQYNCGTALGISDEKPLERQGYSTNIQYYGNLAFGASQGLMLADTANDSVGEVEGVNAPCYHDGHDFVNNTFINALNYNANMSSQCTYRNNTSYIRNNIFMCNGDYGCQDGQNSSNGIVTKTNLTWDYNLWHNASGITTDAQSTGSNDVTGSASLAKASGWSRAAISQGSLDADDFYITGTSDAINNGLVQSGDLTYSLNLDASSFISGVGPSGTGSSAFSLVSHGSTPDIGADVYVTSGSAPATPAAPTAGTPTQTSVSVSWTAVSTATGYYVRYGPTATFPATGTLIATVTDGVSTTLSSLTAETEYSVDVAAYNTSGTSAYSTDDTFTTAAVSGSDLINEDCDAITDWTLSGGVNWTVAGGRCTATDDHATNYAKMTYTVADGLPSEYTLHLEDNTFSDIPATYVTGTAGKRFYVWFANGVNRFAIAWLVDGIYLKNSSNADVLVAGTSSYVTTTANEEWDVIVKADSVTGYHLVSVYRAGTLIGEIYDYLAGDEYTLLDGTVTVECLGTDTDIAEWSFSALTLTAGIVVPTPTPINPHTSAYYAADDCGDIKATSTITVAGGVGTFSVAQTDAALDIHEAKGFEVSFGDPAVKCYVAERMNQSQYVLVDVDGDACAVATAQTVNSFQPPFTTLAGFIAGVDGAGYMTSGALGTLDVDVNLYLGSFTETITTPITIDPFSETSAEDCWRVYGSSGYTLTPNGSVGLIVNSNHGRLYDLQITHSAVDAEYQRSIYLETGSATVVDLEIINPKLRGVFAPPTSGTTNYTRHDGIVMPTANAATDSKLKIISADISGYQDADGTASYGITILDADCKTYVYRATITNGDTGLNSVTDNIICKNCLVNTNNSYSGDYDDDICTNNLGLQDDTPGVNAQQEKTVTFNNAATGDFSLHPTDDHLFFDDGIDLSEDNIFSVTTDRVGKILAVPFSVGAYAAPNSGEIYGDMVTDISSSGFAAGTVTVTFFPTYPIVGDACIWTEGETTLFSDDGGVGDTDAIPCNNLAVEIELTPGLHTILLTVSKAGWADDTATISAVVLNAAGVFYAGTGEGCTTADPTSSNKPTVELDPGTIIILCGTQATFDMSSQPPGIFYLHGDDWSGGTFTGTSSHIIMPASTLSEDSSGLKVMNFTGKNIKFSNVTISGGKAITTTP